MGHGRMQRLTEVESRCFRCDRFRGLREDQPPEQIIVRKRVDPQRMIAESGRHRHVLQVTARTGVADPSSWSQFRAAPITAALASFSRGMSSRTSSRIFVASGHPEPEHSMSTWRRSSSAIGHLIRLATRPPSTRNMMCPRNDTRRAGLTLRRTHRAADASVWRKRANAARPSRV
jgi:hypothetical protein